MAELITGAVIFDCKILVAPIRIFFDFGSPLPPSNGLKLSYFENFSEISRKNENSLMILLVLAANTITYLCTGHPGLITFTVLLQAARPLAVTPPYVLSFSRFTLS